MPTAAKMRNIAANPGMSEEEAEKIMLEWFPTLKRWKNRELQ